MKKLLGILVLAGTTLISCKDKTASESAKIETQKVVVPAKTVVYKDATSNTATTKKEGWSSAAKGAVIGGATGAVAGAVINKKNRAAGAVVGGVAGAGVGYTIGRAKVRKTGRVQPKN